MPGCHHAHDNVDGIARNEPWYDHERDFVKVCHCQDCVHHQAGVIMDALREEYKGTDMQLVACPSPGGCGKGNTVVINDEVIVVNQAQGIGQTVKTLLERQAEEKRLNPDQQREVIKVCFGPTCGQRDAKDIEANLKKNFRDKQYRVMRCGCTGNCAMSNNVVVNGNILHRQNARFALKSVESELSRQRRQRIKETGPLTSQEAEDILGL